MISMQHIGSAGDAARYHDKSFSQDAGKKADNYYVNERATARWEGRGAEILGLKGEAVEKEKFVEFLSGKLMNPKTGEVEDLARNSKGANRRPGMDFTVAPPKSVSIAGLVGGDDRVVAAHLVANARAMEWLEKHGSIIRVRDEDGQIRHERAGNLLYASVLHETNRENEPQIHSHNVIVSAVYDEDRKMWRSLTNDALLKLRAKGDVVYKAELAGALKSLGYELEYGQNGVDFEIKGFSREQIEAYSTRAAQVRDALLKRGIDPGEASFDARRVAKLDSRAAKQEHPRDVLQEIWQDTAKEAGINISGIVQGARHRSSAATLDQTPIVVDRGPTHDASPGQTQDATANAHRYGEHETPVGQGHSRETGNSDDLERTRDFLLGVQREPSVGAVRAVSWAIEHLTEREQSFSLADLEESALKFSRGMINDIDSAVQQHIKNHMLVQRGVADDGQLLYTTHRAIDSEMRLAENIQSGKGEGNVILSTEAEFLSALKSFEEKKGAELAKPFKLSDEQVISARNLLMHPDSFQGIQGEAGTGKTAALAMVNDVALAKGWEVIGMATSAAAAKELESESGMASSTVAAYFAKRDTQIRTIETRVGELRGALVGREKIRDTEETRLESHRLSVRGGDVDFGTNRYTFDHQRGEVFKSPDDLRNAIGARLTDFAAKNRAAVVQAQDGATTFGQRARAEILGAAVNAGESLGRRLSSFEQIGTVEAISARNALFLERDGTGKDIRRELSIKEAELANLRAFGNVEGRKTLIVMDESSLTGAADTERISSLAREIGARTAFQGDIKQHGSVAAGRAFGQAQKAGMNVSVLEETRRFVDATPQTKQALLEMKAGNYSKAIEMLDTHEVEKGELADVVAGRYLDNLNALKARGIENAKVGVVAITNRDRKAINAAIHGILAENGLVQAVGFRKDHLDDPKLTKAEQMHTAMLREKKVDMLIYRKTYREVGVKSGDVVRVVSYDLDKNRIHAVNAQGVRIEINPQRQDYFSPAIREAREFSVGDRVETRAIIRLPEQELKRIDNGTPGIITAIDENGTTVRWTRSGHESRLDNADVRFIDHAYAHTSYKEQGATNHREIIAVSETGAKVFNREAAYVAASRAKDNTEVVTEARERMLKSAGKEVGKTTAVDFESGPKGQGQQARANAVANVHAQNQGNVLEQAAKQREKREASIHPEGARVQQAKKTREAEKVKEQGNLLQF